MALAAVGLNATRRYALWGVSSSSGHQRVQQVGEASGCSWKLVHPDRRDKRVLSTQNREHYPTGSRLNTLSNADHSVVKKKEKLRMGGRFVSAPSTRVRCDATTAPLCSTKRFTGEFTGDYSEGTNTCVSPPRLKLFAPTLSTKYARQVLTH